MEKWHSRTKRNGPFSYLCRIGIDPNFRLHVHRFSAAWSRQPGSLNVIWFKLEESQQGPRLERRTHISVNARSELGPPLSPQGREAYPFPLSHSPSHTTLTLCPSASLTRTLTRLQPASDDAPQRMRFPPCGRRAEPSPSSVFAAREENIGVLLLPGCALRLPAASPQQ